MENMDPFVILTDTKLAFLGVVLAVVPDFFVVAATFLVVVGTLAVEACLTNLL